MLLTAAVAFFEGTGARTESRFKFVSRPPVSLPKNKVNCECITKKQVTQSCHIKFRSQKNVLNLRTIVFQFLEKEISFYSLV